MSRGSEFRIRGAAWLKPFGVTNRTVDVLVQSAGIYHDIGRQRRNVTAQMQKTDFLKSRLST